jgi:hypothetical protein
MSATAFRSQRLQALERANAVRIERARLVGGTGGRAGGKVPPERIAELLLDPPEALLGMRIGQLLTRVQRYRWARAVQLLKSERISDVRLVRELTERQRIAIAGRLREDG